MEVITAGLVIGLVWKIVDALKFASSRDWNGLVTQLTVWVAAIFVLFLAANADLTENLSLIGGADLGSLNGFSLVLAGLLVGSGASTTVDFKQAIDGQDTARKPSLTGLDGIDRPGHAA